LDRIGNGLRNIGVCLIGEAILKGVEGVVHLADENGFNTGSESWQEKEIRLLACAYHGLANSRPDYSRSALDGLIAFAEQNGLLRTKLRALLLRHVVHDIQGRRKLATADFHAALDIGMRTGMRQAFLEFGAETVKARIAAGVPERFAVFAKGLASLLAASQPHRPEDALTRREAQILELLTSGDSDKGIARQLHVTEYGVRFHLKNIYRKLGVHDRNSAISRLPMLSQPFQI
jgi:LuxR family maltose regulon positive regulatory protein